MFANLNAKTFKIDTIVPTLQTAAVFGINEVLGSLGHYSVTSQAAMIVGGVAALVTGVARNFFDNSLARYASTAIGVLAGVGACRFFYPPLQSFDPKAALAIGGVLFVIQAAADFARRPRMARVGAVETVTT